MSDESGLDQAALLTLYETTLAEERHHWEAHRARIGLVISLVSAIFVATVAGLFQAEGHVEHFALLVGPGVIYALARFGFDASKRYYQQYLEIVTQKAKIQHALGMTVDRPGADWWETEPFVPERLSPTPWEALWEGLP